MITPKRIKKVLNNKIGELNDIIADIDSLLTEMETEFYRVTIFGSARIHKGTDLYKTVYDLAYQLSCRGVDIVTGGGPGLMEAANKGAKDGGEKMNLSSRSIGLSIDLPFETDANSHLDVKHQHKRFSSRLDEFMRLSHAVVVTPGGIGTLLELCYTWQLLQVRHIKPRPVLLLGTMWEDLLEWVKKWPLNEKLMNPEDIDHITVVKSVDDVIKILEPQMHAFRASKASQTDT